MKHLLPVFLFGAGLAFPQSCPRPEFTFGARVRAYATRTYTDPGRHISLAGEIAVDNFIFGGGKEWGTGLSGLGKNFAEVEGSRVVTNTVEFLAGAVLRDDPRYTPSGKKGAFSRVWHATSRAFLVKSASGRTIPAYDRLIAVTAGVLITNQWLPKPRTGGELASTIIFGMTDKTQGNLLTEFSPDLRLFGRRLLRTLPFRKRLSPPPVYYSNPADSK